MIPEKPQIVNVYTPCPRAWSRSPNKRSFHRIDLSFLLLTSLLGVALLCAAALLAQNEPAAPETTAPYRNPKIDRLIIRVDLERVMGFESGRAWDVTEA